jgi:hypothetical protein
VFAGAYNSFALHRIDNQPSVAFAWGLARYAREYLCLNQDEINFASAHVMVNFLLQIWAAWGWRITVILLLDLSLRSWRFR